MSGRPETTDVISGEAAISVGLAKTSAPPGWKWVKLTEIARLETGHTPSRNHPEYWGGGIPWIGIKDAREHHGRTILTTFQNVSQLGLDNSASRLLPTGTVCLSRTASVGYVLVMGREMATSQDFVNWVCGPALEPKYLMYALLTEGPNIRRFGKGTTHTTIYFPEAKAFHLCLAPLNEQRRIVAAIEANLTRLDAGVANLERVRAKLKRYRAAVLKAACEGRLVPTEAELARAEGRAYESADCLLARILEARRERWEADQRAEFKAQGKRPTSDKWKLKYEEPFSPKTRDLPRLPEGWTWATMPQLGELNRGRSRHRPRNDPRLLGGPYPFIQTGDVRLSNGTIREYSQTYSEFGLAQSRLWPAGTLCITIAANIAETGILSFPACFPDSIVGFVRDEQPEIVRFVEKSIRNIHQALELYAPTTAQKNINLETLTELAIPLPPLAELVRIVTEVERRLSLIDELDAAVSANLKRADRLRQSILKRAFEGKLVPQDPADEPAAALLERIAGGARQADLFDGAPAVTMKGRRPRGSRRG